MDVCTANYALSVEVRKFIEHVGDAKEESITDYLVWKWRELDKRFNYLRVTPFNHDEESLTTGADFDLELWLVGNSFQISLAVQAKKFIKRSDSYVTRLRYPKGSKAQMDKLLSYAKSRGSSPFYFIYTLPEATTISMCGGRYGLVSKADDGAVFMADAHVMENYANGKHGKRISRDQLLSVANPFHCMFCCPLAGSEAYFNHYFPVASGLPPRRKVEVPSYVRRLLDSAKDSNPKHVALEPAERDGLQAFRIVGVYDMRNDS